MAFGREIGGFKYARPGRIDDGIKNEINPDGGAFDAAVVALNNGPLRAVTAITNRSTQKILVEISKVLDEALQPFSQEQLSKQKFQQGEASAMQQELREEYRNSLVRMNQGWQSTNERQKGQSLSPKDSDILQNIENYVITDQWKNLRTKLEELFIENRHMGKSITRAVTEIEHRSNPFEYDLKAEMQGKIWMELFEPLKEYIAKEQLIPEKVRDKLAFTMDKIYQNHFEGRWR